jgi:hypothetical protein
MIERTKLKPSPPAMSACSAVLQRKRAYGSTPGPIGEREKCRGEGGRSETKLHTESRFGHDFSQTRAHDKSVTPQVATRSTIISRDGDVETRTQALGPPISPVPTPSANYCALTAANFTSIPSGAVAATLNGGRLQAPFVMRATFENPIPCNCSNGEYRQFIRGSFTAGGRAVTHMLGLGRPLSATAFQEDGDVGVGTAYGHRSVPGTKSRFLPDQQGGCQFEGEDEPGITASSGTVVTMNLDFRGDLIDTSASNRVMNTSSWTVSGSATMP